MSEKSDLLGGAAKDNSDQTHYRAVEDGGITICGIALARRNWN